MRCVKQRTLAPNTCKQRAIDALITGYSREKETWLRFFDNRKNLPFLGKPRLVRDEKIKEEYRSPYGLQARHWKLALTDAAETWDKYWKSLFVIVRSHVARNSHLSEDEKHYAYWLLKGYDQFAQMMQGEYPVPPFPLPASSLKKGASALRRLIKKHKKNPPRIKRKCSVRFDADCYSSFEHNNRWYVSLMSLIPGKRIVLPLFGQAKVSGTITLVQKDERLDLHVSCPLKPKKNTSSAIEAVDFGYTEVMTDTEGNRYGTVFGKQITNISEWLHQKGKKRNRLRAIGENKKNKKMRRCNLGRKKHTNVIKRAKTTLLKEINTGINQLIRLKKPTLLITEDLRHSFTFNKSKKLNRKLSSWLKGELQDRIEFKALAEGFRHEQVNPAYGSQSCPACLFVDRKNRTHDNFTCQYCGHEDHADRVAALNYFNRYGDLEIGRYTPYRQVKTILLERFHRRLELGLTKTVTGRTLDTVAGAHPPPLSIQKTPLDGKVVVKAGSVRTRKPGGHSESE